MVTTLTTINNPFNPHDKTIELIKANKPIWNYLIDANDDLEFVVSLNGQITENYELVLKEGDNLAIVPIPKGGGGGGGKNILTTVAMLALVIAAPGIGVAALSTIGATTALTQAAAYGIMYGTQIAVVVGGGMLINSIAPVPSAAVAGAALGSVLESVSPTYAFSGGSNAKDAGSTLPIVLGLAPITPPVISSYLSLQEDKQHLNMLMAVNDGEVDDITNIKINGQDISNFNDIEYSITKGTVEQEPIGNFRDSETTVPLQRNLNVKDAETIYTTLGNSIDELEIVVSFPKGLYYVNNSGSYGSHSVSFELAYKKVGDTVWTPLTKTVNTTYKTTKRLTYNFKDLEKAQYDVRLKRTSDFSEDTRTSNDLQLDYINEIVYDDFKYPAVALLSINALATDQLNGGYPVITCESNNTTTLDINKPKNNPAWACYDLLQREGIPDSDIDLVKFQDWADFCTAKSYYIGLCLDTQQELQAALDMVSLLGRAKVVQFGSVFTPIIERVVDIPTQSFLFTGGNIIDSSFQIDYIPYNERANVIEVTYHDEDTDYKTKTVQVQAFDFDSNSIEIKSSITLYGCTNRNMALEYAQHLLNTNRYISEVCTFTAFTDSITCSVGEVIKVGVRHMTNTLADGRLNTVLGNSITLDQEVTLEANENYELQIRLETDEILTFNVSVVNTETITDTLMLTNVPEIITPVNVVFAFGKQSTEATNLYRVTNITRASDLKRKIVAVEYNPTVYDDTVNIEVEEVIIEDAITNLTVSETLVKNRDGSVDEVLNLTWNGGNALQRTILVNGVNFGESFTNTYELINRLNAGETYTIQVGKQTITHDFLGASKKPDPLTNLTATWVNGEEVLSWDKNNEVDFKHYELDLSGQIYRTSVNSLSLNNLDVGTYSLACHCVDTVQNKSDITNYDIEVNKPCLIYLIRDAGLIEAAFLDGLMTIYTSFDAPIGVNKYDIWKVSVENMDIGDYTFNDEALTGLTWDTGSNKELYKYYTGTQWILCTTEQMAVVRRMLGQLTTAGIVDNEVKVYNIEPYAPYEINDLWIDGNNIKRCTSTRLTGAFDASDWILDSIEKISIATKLENTIGAA